MGIIFNSLHLEPIKPGKKALCPKSLASLLLCSLSPASARKWPGVPCPQLNNSKTMQIKTNFQQRIEGHKWAVFRLKKLSVHALPGLCSLNIFEYEISLSCGKFRNHHREPLFGHGNTFDWGRPVVLHSCHPVTY